MKPITKYLLLVASCLCALSTSAQLTSNEKSYSFGELPAADTLYSHPFQLCNEGSDTLLINRVELAKDLIIENLCDSLAPDMGLTLSLAINASQTTGKFRKSLFIYSNTSTLRIYIEGNIVVEPEKEEDIPQEKASTRSDKKKKKKEKRE